MTEELKIIISAEVAKVKQGVKEAKTAIGTFKSESAKSKKEIGEAWNTMGNAATSASKVMIGGIAAVGGALLALGASTQEYRNEQAKLITAFEAAGGSATEAKETYNDLFRVLGDSGQATEAASHLAKLTTEEKALSEWTNICQGVYATFGDSLPIEGLTEAANETAKVGTVTGGLADALNWAGVSEDAFNEKLAACNDEAEREKLIRETLNGLYSDASAKYEENNAAVLAQNEAQAKLQETTAKLGEAVAPVVTAFTNFASEALAIVVPYIQQLADQYMPRLQEVLGNISSSLAPIGEFIVNNLPLIAGIAGTILGIAAAYQVVTGALAAYNAIKTTYTAVTAIATAAQTAFAAANIAALAPILAVVAGVAAVIAIIVLCVKHWDKISATVKKVWQNIKQATSEAVSSVVNKFNDLRNKAVEKVNSLKTAFTQGFSNMVSSAREKVSSIFSVVSEKFNSIKSKITETINGAKNAVKSAIDAIKGFFNFKWSLPKLKMPSIKITGKFSLNPPSVPKFSINWNKLGGVFDKPTLFNYGGSLQGIGEDGAEAVVPLEKNTQWLDRLADMLNERMGSSTPIVLTVDGKVFAQTAISTINQQTRQTGKLALNLV